MDAAAKAKAQLSALSSLPPCDLDPLSIHSPAHYQGPAPSRSQGNILTRSSAAIYIKESKARPLNFITKMCLRIGF